MDMEKYFKDKYHNSSDLVTRTINIKNNKITYVFLESVSSDDKISNFFMKNIDSYLSNNKILLNNLFTKLENSIPNSHVVILSNINECFSKLSAGYTAIFINDEEKYIMIETKSTLDRGVTESTSEAIIRGPKDSFTENNSINLGLIRKRIKTPDLIFHELTIGDLTNTKVIVSYINNLANKKNINKIISKLEKVNLNSVIDSGYIRDLLIEDNSIFPKIKSTERPDLASMSLLEGKIIILVENTPFVLILPTTLDDYLHTPEDYYQKKSNVSLTRILRALSFVVTIITPGLYIGATTFNQELIPNKLLISFAIQREGVPFPTSLEILLMIMTFEILRESDIRLPSKMGAAISIVGALVLGDAAVAAGIVSPIVIIVVGITSICGLLFTDIDFVNAIRWWRFIFLLFGSILGLLGIFVGCIIFISKLSSMTSLETSYLKPFSPLSLKGIKESLKVAK